jgi:hypothetical protein
MRKTAVSYRFVGCRMPGLASRLGAESIDSLQRAAKERYEEATLLFYGSRKYAAVYLYGYAIEMWLKAAFFHNEGLKGVFDSLDRSDLQRGWNQHGPAGIVLPPGSNWHSYEVWADLLVYIRRVAGFFAPYPPAVELRILQEARNAKQHWDVSMRYNHVAVSDLEVIEVRDAATWFQQNYFSL